MESVEARARASLGFAGTLMVAAPAFLGVLGCVIGHQTPKVVDDDVQLIAPGLMTTEHWLKASTSEFRWNMLLWAVDDWDTNRAIVRRMAKIAKLAAGLLGLQAVALAIWVLGF